MELETEVLERVGTWDRLSRWERSELGKGLRRLGLSYGEIMDLVPVKKSTLATWCRGVELTVEQIEAIKERTGSRRGESVDTQWRRRREIALIEAQAALEAEHLLDDPLWTAGVALYWGEGTKTTRRLQMAHSEPDALRFLMGWVRRFLDPWAVSQRRSTSISTTTRRQPTLLVEGTGNLPRRLHEDLRQA